MSRGGPEELESWLTSRLKEKYPLHDDWVVEGISSACLSCGDKLAALDTVAGFLGDHAELGNLLDELFRRKGEVCHPRNTNVGEGLNSADDRADKVADKRKDKLSDSFTEATGAEVKKKSSKSKTLPLASTATALDLSNKPLQPEDFSNSVVNCLACGKIFDCRPKDGVMSESAKALLESLGECTFCGTRVALEVAHEDAARGSDAGKKKGKALKLSGAADTSGEKTSASTGTKTSMLAKMTSHYVEDCGVSTSTLDADTKAKHAKDRLVHFDSTAASRTVVIDDQSDWYEIDGNAWLDESERIELKKQAAVGAVKRNSQLCLEMLCSLQTSTSRMF